MDKMHEAGAPFVLVATLIARRECWEDFRTFERSAEAIMARHGGLVLAAVVIDLAARGDTVKEIHVVSFPDRRAFDAYRMDPELAQLGSLRERSVLSTTIRFAPE